MSIEVIATLICGPIWESNGRGDSTGLFETGVDPLLIRHELDLVRAKSNSDGLHTKSLFVKGKRMQTEGLRESANIALPIEHRPICVDVDRLRQPAIDGIGFVYDDDSRIPDLVERVVYDSTFGVSQASVFPAQNYGNVSCERLLCAVDAIDVDEEYID